MKISYCSTCLNRFCQLKDTLEKNLNAVKDDSLIEFIIVDFNGDDSIEMSNWILENFKNELDNSRLKYYKRKNKGFIWNVQIACNTSYRFSTGDIIVNLDCDNFIQINDSQIIRSIFDSTPNILLHMSKYNLGTITNIEKYDIKIKEEYKHLGTHETGDAGRFAILREKLLNIGGWDENIIDAFYGDTDFIIRSLKSGLEYVHKKPFDDDSIITNIPNPPVSTERYNQLWAAYYRNTTISDHNIRNNILIANTNGFNENLSDYQLLKN